MRVEDDENSGIFYLSDPTQNMGDYVFAKDFVEWFLATRLEWDSEITLLWQDGYSYNRTAQKSGWV